MKSGAYSPRKVGPLAEEMLAELLAADWIPERVKALDCRDDLAKLARLRARVQLLTDEAPSMDLDEVTTPRRANGRSPFEILDAAENQAWRLEQKLRIDPMSLLEEQQEAKAEADLEAMAALGAEIRARREAELGGPPG